MRGTFVFVPILIMRITVLTDNMGYGELRGEWGLSLHIEYEGRRYLLDTGASDTFLQNAGMAGIDISDVDAAVISHAHYDHTGGLETFVSVNKKAPVYLSPHADENCYGGFGLFHRYIGLPKGLIQSAGDRIIRTEGITEIAEGVTLIPHSTPGLERLGRRNSLYVRKGFRYFPDDFSHEQTLVFRTKNGLAVMNSCSHSGPEVIADEVLKAFPGERITAYIGGLHLFRLKDDEVETTADRLETCGMDMIYTGHCTGQKAFDILQKRFGEKIVQFRCGMVTDL